MNPADLPDGPILVDTDVATWLLTGQEGAVPWRPLLRGHVLALSFVNVGELMALPVSKSWGTHRIDAWRESIRTRFVVIPFDAKIAELWAPMHVKYRGHLQHGGANDLWIAATALAVDPVLALATNNLNDFSKVAADHPLILIHPDA
jgi:predicted nucleic acid-binding protein